MYGHGLVSFFGVIQVTSKKAEAAKKASQGCQGRRERSVGCRSRERADGCYSAVMVEVMAPAVIFISIRKFLPSNYSITSPKIDAQDPHSCLYGWAPKASSEACICEAKSWLASISLA